MRGSAENGERDPGPADDEEGRHGDAEQPENRNLPPAETNGFDVVGGVHRAGGIGWIRRVVDRQHDRVAGVQWVHALILLLAAGCASQKATHAEEQASATLSADEHAEAEAAASSSETRTQEPTQVEVTTTTEVFQPVPQGPDFLHNSDAGPPALIRRTTTRRVEQRGAVRTERQAEASGRASEAISIDAGVAVVSVADSSAKSAPAASCAFAGGLAGPLIVLAAVLGMAVYRRMTRS